MEGQTASNQIKPSSAPSNKTVLMVLVVIVILLVSGGYFLYQDSSEKTTNQAIENTGKGGDKSEAKTKGGENTIIGNKIPDNFPSDITVYKKAELVKSIEESAGVTLTLNTSDSTTKATDFYKKDIEENGWTISSISNFEDSFLITAEKGDRSLLITVSPDKNNGKTSITLVVSIPN